MIKSILSLICLFLLVSCSSYNSGAVSSAGGNGYRVQPTDNLSKAFSTEDKEELRLAQASVKNMDNLSDEYVGNFTDSPAYEEVILCVREVV